MEVGCRERRRSPVDVYLLSLIQGVKDGAGTSEDQALPIEETGKQNLASCPSSMRLLMMELPHM